MIRVSPKQLRFVTFVIFQHSRAHVVLSLQNKNLNIPSLCNIFSHVCRLPPEQISKREKQDHCDPRIIVEHT